MPRFSDQMACLRKITIRRPAKVQVSSETRRRRIRAQRTKMKRLKKSMNQLPRLPIRQSRLTRQMHRSMRRKSSRKPQLSRQRLPKPKNRTLISMTGRTPSTISPKPLQARPSVRTCRSPRPRAKSSHLMRRRRRRKNQARSREPPAEAVKSKRSRTIVQHRATQRSRMLRVAIPPQLAAPDSSSC